MTSTRWRAILALVLTFGLASAAAACGDDDDAATDDTTDAVEAIDGPTIRLAPQDFPEAVTLTEIYGQYLEAKGFDIDLQAPNGFRTEVYPDLESGDLDMIIDFTGSAARYLNPEVENTTSEDETYANLEAALEPIGLVAFEHAPAEDRNALVVLKTFADEHDLTTISDLADVEGGVTLGALEDCRERPDCKLGYENPEYYGLTFNGFTALEYGPPLTEALEAGVIQAAQYSSAAPQIASGNFVVLEDDKALLSRDNIVPVLRSEIADAYGDALRDAIDELSAQLTTEVLIDLNIKTDIDKEEPADVATAWLEDEGLI
jgi:osmoprotectant transport system substrate-binding protein